MHFAWISVRKDLRRLARNIPALLCWLLLPLTISSLIGLVFGRHNATPQGLLLIADEDRGFTASFVREAVGRGPLGSMMAVRQTDTVEGREQLARGDASALLIVPKGFDRAVLRGETASLDLVTNPEQQIMPQLAREVASLTVDAAVWIQQARGTRADDLSLLDLTVGGARTSLAFQRYLNPPRIDLKTTVITPPGVPKTIGDLLFPGAVFLVVLIVAQGMGVEIWKEREFGAVRRLLGTASGVHAFLAGKVAAMSIVFAAANALSFAAGRLLFHVRIDAPLQALAWAVACTVVVYLGLLVIEMLLANQRTALVVANIFVIPLAMLGGSFFPIEIMPERFAHIAQMVPNGWMLLQFKSILAGQPPASMLGPYAVLLAAAAPSYLIAGWLMRRRLVD